MVAPRGARDSADSCSVHVVDSAGDWEDHFLVALRAPLALRSTQWRVEGVDRAALKDPVCCCKFKSALGAINRPLGPCLLMSMGGMLLVLCVRPPGPLSVRL